MVRSFAATVGKSADVENVLAKEFYRLACYADLVALAPGSSKLRIYQTSRLLRDDGHLVRVLIYFVLRDNDAVELQHADVVKDEKM
ncbi:MAG: hypothetical protein ACR2HH_05875 [Chthoniobacterales bacterium]